MRRALLFLAIACGCSTKEPVAPTPCVVHFSGDVDDTQNATSCGVSSSDAGVAFTAHASGSGITSLDVSIDLAATSGTFSSATISSWSASATTGDAGCAFTAGGADVPPGSFTLTLDADADAGAHGTLALVLLVHAPPLTDCGPHDVENVELTF